MLILLIQIFYNSRKQLYKLENLYQAWKIVNKTIKISCYYNPELIKNTHTKKITACPKQENLKLIWLQKVLNHLHNLEETSFHTMNDCKRTKGSVKSLLKLLLGEMISRTYINTFFYSQYWILNMKIWTDLTVQIYSYKINYMIITCKRTWKPKTKLKKKNNNSAAITVVRSDKSRTRG